MFDRDDEARSYHYSVNMENGELDVMEGIVQKAIDEARADGEITKAAALELQLKLTRPWMEWVHKYHRNHEAVGVAIPNAFGSLLAQTILTLSADAMRDNDEAEMMSRLFSLMEFSGRIAVQCIEQRDNMMGTPKRNVN